MTTADRTKKKIEDLENFKVIVGKFIAKLGDPSKYEYRGEVIDLVEYGKGKCTCDHPVRYMFLIWGPNGQVAPVGCECIKHFQSYNEGLYNSLENARMGLHEALLAEERAKTKAMQEAKKDEIYPRFVAAKLRFKAICRMHRDRIYSVIPKPMWALEQALNKQPSYKTTRGLIKYMDTTLLRIEQMVGQYEKGEVR